MTARTDRLPATRADACRQRVDELLAAAPPLTEEQISRAVAILARPPEAASVAATTRRTRTFTTPDTERQAA